VAAAIKLYWSSGLKNGKKNFGDWLGPELVKQLSGRDIEHVTATRADLISVGSILQKLDNYWWRKKVQIWGSGFIEKPDSTLSRHIFCAARGKLSAQFINTNSDMALGDPGLLSSELLPDYADIQKTVRVGVIPHYKDQNHPSITTLPEQLRHCKMINVLDEPLHVLREIARCERVISSSLHGLVVADSFGIPSQWLKVSDQVRGNDFKFYDYYSAFNIINPTFKTVTQISDASIDELGAICPTEQLLAIKKRLHESFPYLK
jgi:hypothetical protein